VDSFGLIKSSAHLVKDWQCTKTLSEYLSAIRSGHSVFAGKV
jgi:hypothetical protein